MPYAILPATTTAMTMNNNDYLCQLNDNGHSAPNSTSFNDINNKYTPSSAIPTNNAVNFTVSLSDSDISKQHLETLRARLGLARFKMNQGWESSTFGDVQQLWKKRQQKLIDELPKPRFTQRDIIDKRVYIPSPGAKYAKTKKSKLTRTLSSPITTSDFYQHQYFSKKNSICSQQQPDSTASAPGTTAVRTGHCSRSREVDSSFLGKRSLSISSPMASTASTAHLNSPPQPPVRNSLDYLSYAIEMTECDEEYRSPSPKQARLYSSQPLPATSPIDPTSHSGAVEDEDEDFDNNDIPQRQNDDLTTVENSNKMDIIERQASFTIESQDSAGSPPSSPMTTAAKAILMFSHNDDQKQHHCQHSDLKELSIPSSSQRTLPIINTVKKSVFSQ